MNYQILSFQLQHCCNGRCSTNSCTAAIDQYYRNIMHYLVISANNCVPVKKSGYQKHWWSDELDELKQVTIDATNYWRSVGCPRSGVFFNNNRLQCKYRYKMAIKMLLIMRIKFSMTICLIISVLKMMCLFGEPGFNAITHPASKL